MREFLDSSNGSDGSSSHSGSWKFSEVETKTLF
jgi:hypothetical protein